jgi:hypothetical protein
LLFDYGTAEPVVEANFGYLNDGNIVAPIEYLRSGATGNQAWARSDIRAVRSYGEVLALHAPVVSQSIFKSAAGDPSHVEMSFRPQRGTASGRL